MLEQTDKARIALRPGLRAICAGLEKPAGVDTPFIRRQFHPVLRRKSAEENIVAR